MYSVTCSARTPSLDGLFEPDNLSAYELKRRDELIKAGIDECKALLRQQKTREDYFLYDGSIAGFEACRSFFKFSDYHTALKEVASDLEREFALSIKPGEDEVLDHIRESLHIYEEEITDDDQVCILEGKRRQIQFVYNRLKTIRMMWKGLGPFGRYLL